MLFHGAAVGCTLFLLGAALLPRLRHVRLPAWFAVCLSAFAGVGAFSYGLYLLHVPVLRAFVAIAGGGLGSACAAVVASLAIALVAERYSPLGRGHQIRRTV